MTHSVEMLWCTATKNIMAWVSGVLSKSAGAANSCLNRYLDCLHPLPAWFAWLMIFHLLLHFSIEVSPHLREWSCKSWPMVWQLSGRFSIGYPVIPMCLRIRISLVYPKNAGSTFARKIWKIDHFQVIKCRSNIYKYRSAIFHHIDYHLPEI